MILTCIIFWKFTMRQLKFSNYIIFSFLCLVFQFKFCYASVLDDQIRKITDEDLQSYLGTICIERGDHIGLTAIGHCSQCGGMTPCCNMSICCGCAAERGDARSVWAN